MKGCNLNRKPYTDKHGVFRQRMECCGNPSNCRASEHSEGIPLSEIQSMKKVNKRDFDKIILHR